MKTRWPIRILAITLALALWSVVTQTLQARTVEEFLAMRDKWSELIGVRFKIEGRLSTAAGNIVILKNCKGIQFRSPTELPIFREKNIVVEVTGVLREDQAKRIYLEVTNLKNLGTDIARLKSMRANLLRTDLAGLYRLGEWAEKRGTYYDDQELIAESRKIFQSAVQKERIALENPTYADLRKLVRKVDQYSLSEDLKVSFIYEGLYRGWLNLRKEATADELWGWAIRTSQELRGADKPMANFDEELLKKYRETPLQYHDNASPSQRPDVHRMLFIEICRDAVNTMADKDGKNGVKVADKIEELVPELTDWASEFRRRELDYRMTQVEKLRRSEMLRLRRDLEEHKRSKDSQLVLDRWFAHRTQVLRAEGPTGVVQLAIEYDELRGDRKAAIRLLLEAERRRPGLAKVAQLLESYGFKNVKGIWKSPEQIVQAPETPITIAMREGRVVKGMTANQVEKTLGAPDEMTRLLTSRRVIDYWVYRINDDEKLSVRFSRVNVTHKAIVDNVLDLAK